MSVRFHDAVGQGPAFDRERGKVEEVGEIG
jgi:hypothetical protein